MFFNHKPDIKRITKLIFASQGILDRHFHPSNDDEQLSAEETVSSLSKVLSGPAYKHAFGIDKRQKRLAFTLGGFVLAGIVMGLMANHGQESKS